MNEEASHRMEKWTEDLMWVSLLQPEGVAMWSSDKAWVASKKREELIATDLEYGLWLQRSKDMKNLEVHD